jgi:AcrR family transcriptional regulator
MGLRPTHRDENRVEWCDCAAIRASNPNARLVRLSAKKTKHQIKTETTLRDLLDAAEKVFVREGFERAQIESIAAEMGRTKGSVYAHFKNKKDLFIAFLESRARIRIESTKAALAGLSPQRQREILRERFMDAASDEQWCILLLEFKLFALRNTTSKERVKELYKLLSADIGQLFQAAGQRRKKDVDFAAAMIRGIPSALILERQFDHLLQNHDATSKALGDIFDSIFPE